MFLDLLACALDVFTGAVHSATGIHTNQQRGHGERNQDYSFNHSSPPSSFRLPFPFSQLNKFPQESNTRHGVLPGFARDSSR